MRGRRPSLINREPSSTHLGLLEKHGFQTVIAAPVQSPTEVPRSKLAPRFQALTDEDLMTSGLFLLATRR